MLSEIKTVGIVNSLSPQLLDLAEMISAWGYQVVFISPRQEVSVDLLICYTDLIINPCLTVIGKGNIPFRDQPDTWLEYFMITDSFDWYLENNIPILGLHNGVLFFKEFLKVYISNNPINYLRDKMLNIEDTLGLTWDTVLCTIPKQSLVIKDYTSVTCKHENTIIGFNKENLIVGLQIPIYKKELIKEYVDNLTKFTDGGINTTTRGSAPDWPPREPIISEVDPNSSNTR